MPNLSIKKCEFLIIAAITLERLAQGIFGSLPPATLVDLAAHFNTNVQETTKVLTFRGIGSVIGCILTSTYLYFANYNSKFNPLSLCGVAMVLMGVTNIITPLMPNMDMVDLILTLSCIINGFLDICLQSLIITCWAGNGFSRGLVQYYHGLWRLGSTVGPYIALPFVVSSGSSIDSVCFGNGTDANQSEVSQISDGISKIAYPWFIVGLLFVSAGVISMILGVARIHCELIKNNNESTSKSNKEEPLIQDNTSERSVLATILGDTVSYDGSEIHQAKYAWLFSRKFKKEITIVILTFVMFIFLGSNNHWLSDLSYNFAFCVKKWSHTNSSTLVALCGIIFTFGRFLGIFGSRILKPSTYLCIDMVLVIIGYILLSFFWKNEYHDSVTWVLSAFICLASSSAYACGVNFVAQFFDVTKIYSMVFGLGNFTGQSFLALFTDMLIYDTSSWMICASVQGIVVLSLMGLIWFIGNKF